MTKIILILLVFAITANSVHSQDDSEQDVPEPQISRKTLQQFVGTVSQVVNGVRKLFSIEEGIKEGVNGGDLLESVRRKSHLNVNDEGEMDKGDESMIEEGVNEYRRNECPFAKARREQEEKEAKEANEGKGKGKPKPKKKKKHNGKKDKYAALKKKIEAAIEDER